MNNTIYYLVTIDFYNESKPEPDIIQNIIVGSCFTDITEIIFRDLADDADVVGIHIEEIGEYPTVEEINNFINNRKKEK